MRASSAGKHIVQQSGLSHSILGSAVSPQSVHNVSKTPKPTTLNSHTDWSMLPVSRLLCTKNTFKFVSSPESMLGTSPVRAFSWSERISSDAAFPMFSGILPSSSLLWRSIFRMLCRSKSLVGMAPVNWFSEKSINSKSRKLEKVSRMFPVSWFPASDNLTEQV